MTLEQGFLALLGVTCAVLGWLARELWGAVVKLRQDLEALRVHIAEHYVRDDRMEKALEKALQPVMESFKRIETALKDKVDKP